MSTAPAATISAPLIRFTAQMSYHNACGFWALVREMNTSVDRSDFKLWHMEMPTSFNPFGTRGIGEGGTIGARAAMANAVTDALRDYDVAVDGSGPFKPTWIMEALSSPPRGSDSVK